MLNMNLNVAHNWDKLLSEKLVPYAATIQSFYGRVRSVPLPGGRARTSLLEISHHDAETQIHTLRAKGYKFNYLLNASPHDEFGEAKSHIIQEIKWIGRIADAVVLTSPYLAELCRMHAPNLEIHVSILAHVDSPLKARRWAEFGARKIAPDWKVLRRFQTLNAMVETVAPFGARIELLVNDPCLLECPYVLCHDQAMARGSNAEEYEHYWTLRCCRDYMQSSAEVIRSTFIRPEDLHFYESIGINDFKIADRNRPTDFIVAAVAAYSERRYEGNLADILSIFSAVTPHSAEAMETSGPPECMPDIDQADTIKQRDFFWKNRLRPAMGIRIDNRSLDGFLRYFVDNECSTACPTCRYCDTWAARAVSFPRKEDALRRINLVLDKIHGDSSAP